MNRLAIASVAAVVAVGPGHAPHATAYVDPAGDGKWGDITRVVVSDVRGALTFRIEGRDFHRAVELDVVFDTDLDRVDTGEYWLAIDPRRPSSASWHTLDDRGVITRVTYAPKFSRSCTRTECRFALSSRDLGGTKRFAFTLHLKTRWPGQYSDLAPDTGWWRYTLSRS